MGKGENIMKTWAYAAAGTGVAVSFLLLIFAILVMVVTKDDTENLNKVVFNFAIFMLCLSVVGTIISGVGIWKVYTEHELYLNVSSRFAQKRIENIPGPSTAAVRRVPVQTNQAQATHTHTNTAQTAPVRRVPVQTIPQTTSPSDNDFFS